MAKDEQQYFTMPKKNPYCCQEAKAFAEWVDTYSGQIIPLGNPPTEAKLHHYLAVLTRHWWNVRMTLTPEHRDQIFNDEKKRCVYGVYVFALEQAFSRVVTVAPKLDPSADDEEVKPPNYQYFGTIIGSDE